MDAPCCNVLLSSMLITCRRGARLEQIMKLGEQALFMNNALPLLSIVQAKPGAAPDYMYPGYCIHASVVAKISTTIYGYL